VPALPLTPRQPPRLVSGGREESHPSAVRILMVEDSVADAELALRELRRAGMQCEIQRVETAANFIRALEQFSPKVILSDFSMPEFDGAQALSLALKLKPEVPFIFVSGVMGEEYAIRALKDGATDYVLKSNMLRLPAAVERALREAEARQARERLEQELHESEHRHRELFEVNPQPMWIYDVDSLRFLTVNQAAIRRYGYTRQEFLAMTIKDIRPRDEVARMLHRVGNPIGPDEREIWRHLTKTGEQIFVEIASRELQVGESRARLVVIYDVTERQKAEGRLRDSESRFRDLIEQAADGIYLSDVEGNFIMVNTRGCELLGYDNSELTGANARITYVEEEVDAYRQRLQAVAAGETLRYERMVRRKDGTTFPAEISFKMLSNGMVQAIFHDISRRREHEEKIIRLTRIHAVLSSINSAIVRMHDRKELMQEACRIASQHAAFHIAWIGLIEDDVLKPKAWAGTGSEFFARIAESGSGIKLSPGGLANRAASERRTAFSNDITDNPGLDFVRQEAVNMGCQSAIALPLFVSGAPVGIFMLYCDQKNFFDAEEVKLLEELAGDVSFALTFIANREKVDFLASYDALTGLPNRAVFFERLAQHLAGAARDDSKIALVLLNLDRFRMVNDTLGRGSGDSLLQAVTQRLKVMVRDQDIIARVGADIFALAIAGRWQAENFAYALEIRSRQVFGEPYVLGNEEVRVSASAGVAFSPADGDNPELLFANAEAALRKAKTDNARFLFYSPEMNVRVADSLRMETQLRRAIENQELVLWYQPKIDLGTGKLKGFEALMRWQHPETGIVPPGKFIPLMEQTGLIYEAGNWALSQVAKDCRSWTRQGLQTPRIAVNVSPLQLRKKEFVSKVIEAASDTEVAGGALDLEITESVIMENVEAIIPVLQTIRGLGVEISVDDFGTGYSSLAYIARLPIHALKIDRSFVVGMTQNDDSLAIVRSVISLAHSLRLHVIAEGMETQAQANLLRELDCDQGQGYLISPPVPMEDVPALIRRLQ
jgi:diguanylate cyclase (GGDEF)-like protein/PAS domain S-box-containing protein